MPRELQYTEIGNVKSIRGCILIVNGLLNAVNGQLVLIGDSGSLGTIVGYTKDEAHVLILKENHLIKTGDEVRSTLEPFNVPVGDKFIGRMVNPLCEPKDNLGPVEADGMNPIFPAAPAILDRQPLEKTLETGIKVLDVMIPLGCGQRQLILGNKSTGKTTVLTDVIINQKNTDVICIYCAIGKARSHMARIVELFNQHDCWDYSMVVSAPASAPPGQMYLAPYVACSIAEYWRDQGKHVFIGFDDFTKHAWCYREISLLLGRAPGRDSYPGDIFYLHSKMIERACYLSDEKGKGSMTFIPVVEVLEGDLTAFVPTNLISMTDGQIFVDAALFGEGQRPALDAGLSVSRVGSKVQWPVIKKLGAPLRLEFLQYRELKRISQLRTGGQSEEQEAKLKAGEILTRLLVQDKDSPVPMEVLAVILYAYHKKYLHRLTLEEVDVFQNEIRDYVTEKDSGLMPSIREKKDIEDDDEKKVNDLLAEYVEKVEENRPPEEEEKEVDIISNIGKDVLEDATTKHDVEVQTE